MAENLLRLLMAGPRRAALGVEPRDSTPSGNVKQFRGIASIPTSTVYGVQWLGIFTSTSQWPARNHSIPHRSMTDMQYDGSTYFLDANIYQPAVLSDSTMDDGFQLIGFVVGIQFPFHSILQPRLPRHQTSHNLLYNEASVGPPWNGPIRIS